MTHIARFDRSTSNWVAHCAAIYEFQSACFRQFTWYTLQRQRLRPPPTNDERLARETRYNHTYISKTPSIPRVLPACAQSSRMLLAVVVLPMLLMLHHAIWWDASALKLSMGVNPPRLIHHRRHIFVLIPMCGAKHCSIHLHQIQASISFTTPHISTPCSRSTISRGYALTH